MASAFFWQNSVSLFPASFFTPRSNLPVTPGISWLPILHSSPLGWKGHLFWVLVLEGLVGLHRNFQLQHLQHHWLGSRLRLLWYLMVCLGNEQTSFCCFWDCTQYCISDSFVDYECYSISSKEFLPTVVDIMVIWIKFTHSSPFYKVHWFLKCRCSLLPSPVWPLPISPDSWT